MPIDSVSPCRNVITRGIEVLLDFQDPVKYPGPLSQPNNKTKKRSARDNVRGFIRSLFGDSPV